MNWRIDGSDFDALEQYGLDRFEGEQPATSKFYAELSPKKSSPIYMLLKYAVENKRSYEQALGKAIENQREFPKTLTSQGITIAEKLNEIDNAESNPIRKELLSQLWIAVSSYSSANKNAFIKPIQNICSHYNINPKTIKKFNRAVYGETDE